MEYTIMRRALNENPESKHVIYLLFECGHFTQLSPASISLSEIWDNEHGPSYLSSVVKVKLNNIQENVWDVHCVIM